MTTFIYIDYGRSPDIETELRYSLATLFEEYRGREPPVVIYTDRPDAYGALHARVSARGIGLDFAAWSRNALYAHRVKPCALIDALNGEDETCVLLDTDTFVRPGFAEALARAMANGGAAMDHFERVDPYPECAGFRAQLPHLGSYVYDPKAARMYNSGLVAAKRSRHLPMLEDALALIDALIDAGKRQFNIEQIAVSESFRLHAETIAEMKPYFEHYYRRSQKLYMRPRIARLLARADAFRAIAPALEPSRSRVRLARVLKRLTGRD